MKRILKSGGCICAAVVAATSAAAPASAVAAPCPDVLDYGSWQKAPDQQWDYSRHGVAIVGAEHSRDPSHPQFARIAANFAEVRPTLVLFEGPDRGIAGERDAAIAAGGESAFARLLARDAGVPTRSLEPSPGAQIAALTREFPMDQVLLFFVLREAARMRDREGRAGHALDASVGGLLGKVAGMADSSKIALPFRDLAGLQAAFAVYWPGRDWRTVEGRWFDPLADDAATGGVFAAAVNRADSRNRNRHLVQTLEEAARGGERPFVVIGRNHVPMIAPALDCRLGAGVAP